jgi:RNA recognition motif-containing protein
MYNDVLRGFAFVVFKTVEGLKDAVGSEEHAVKGKKVAVKKAQAKQGKVYVGKLKAELSDEEIKSHFEQFGHIAQVVSNVENGAIPSSSLDSLLPILTPFFSAG